MSLWLRKSRILITCAKGITPYLREEISALGYPVLAETTAAIETEGTLAETLPLNLHLRTAHRVLYLLKVFPAMNPGELYGAVNDVPWEELIDASGYVCVTSSVDNPTIKDSRFANLKCKDAIVDRIAKTMGRRPDSGPSREKAVAHLYWQGDEARLYLDTSGEPLARRGYRLIPLVAPMQETLAAAVIQAAGWGGRGNFINPMCGSGTLAIEAALLSLNRAPGLLRRNFGFMHIKGYDDKLQQRLWAEARAAASRRVRCRIIATDISREAIPATKENARKAGVEHVIEFRRCDYTQTDIPPGGGLVVLNPPYGERLGRDKALEMLYAGIGDFFKKKCSGYRGYVFTGNLALAKRIGLRTGRRLIFYNGEIECRLLEYDLYAGSVRPEKIDTAECADVRSEES
ncbi:MAG: class I SAM-dependent RNA methyltransferase [Smithellaceae bacterium]|nr:class I SAM-dependent RNA methyltransferase [Smithellaceae bacterium]